MKDWRWKHGYGHHPSREYRSWAAMLSRCRNPAHPRYVYYGGRGIRVAEAWVDFRAFLSDMGPCPPGHTIDRIDVNGHYEPGNCRWATSTTQNRNRRDNIRLTVEGETLCVAEWASRTGVSASTIYRRVHAGWPPREAISMAPMAPQLRSKSRMGGSR